MNNKISLIEKKQKENYKLNLIERKSRDLVKRGNGDLLISKKHNVYSNNYNPSSLLKSSVVTTGILPFNNSFNSESLDQIRALMLDDLYFKANAEYGKSSIGLDFLASSKNLEYSFFGIGEIFWSMRNNTYHNLESSNFEYLSNFSSFLLVSSKIYSGVTSLYPRFLSNLINSSVYPLLIKEANITSASTTSNFIFYKCLLETAEFTSLPSSIACFSVNSLSPNISLASENLTSSCICLINLFNTSSALSSSPSGTSNLKVSSAIIKDNVDKYINVSDFNLMPIKQVYENINGGGIYILYSNNNPVKVKLIAKQNYLGRIYDDNPGERDTYGAWSGEWKIEIQSEVVISLPVDTVNFGSLGMDETSNTTDDSPAPFEIQNNGNCFLNIKLGLIIK